jgi:hypothetical protein
MYPLHPQRASAQDGINHDFARMPRGAVIVALVRYVPEPSFEAQTPAHSGNCALDDAVHNFAACPKLAEASLRAAASKARCGRAHSALGGVQRSRAKESATRA